MTKKRALLMVKTDAPAQESEWNNWYNRVHAAARLKIPGFLSVRRFNLLEGIPKPYYIGGEAQYLALYDLADIDVLKSRPYRRLREEEKSLPSSSFEAITPGLPKFVAGVYEQIFPEQDYVMPATRLVFVIGHDVPRNRQKEYNIWYNTEHFPGQLSVPGFIAGRRFQLNERATATAGKNGESLPKYLTVYDMKSVNVFETEVWRKAARTPWSDWVRSWYARKIDAVFQQIYRKQK